VPDLAELERAREETATDAYAAGSDDKQIPKQELEGVFVHDGERVRFRPVKLGITGESEVEVLEGLSEGEELVTGSYKILRTIADGDFVTVENHASDLVPRRRRSGSP